MALPAQRCVAKRVAIIGAGSSGMAAAKYLYAEHAFDVIDIYEQRSHIGGIWKYTAQTHGDGLFTVPQTNAQAGLEQQLKPMNCSDEHETTFMSPLYERLETNIPKTLMGYSDKSFPDEFQLFPRHDQVQAYLESYGAELQDKILFNRQVYRVEPVDKTAWQLHFTDRRSGFGKFEIYDAIAVATGHFSVPYIPDIAGLKEWNSKHEGSILHSKYYRLPEHFSERKVIIIGSSASGLDIASQISPLCKAPLLVSQRSVSPLAGGFAHDPNIEFCAEISHVDGSSRTVYFQDGRVETEVDHLLFCTGYLYSFPFAKELEPPPVTDGLRVEHTYKHLFYAPRPTLAFLTLPQKIIPFPIAEAQSAVLARVWSGRLTLPLQAEMEAWEKKVIAEQGDGGDFHTLQFPKDAEYINELHDWAASAAPREHLEEKLPKRWGEYEYWARKNFPAIRKAFVSKGGHRKHITTLEEVGFKFDPGAITYCQSKELSK